MLLVVLSAILGHLDHLVLVSFNFPLAPESNYEASLLACGGDYDEKYENLLQYDADPISAWALHGATWNKYLDAYLEIQIEVENSEGHAARLQEALALKAEAWSGELLARCQEIAREGTCTPEQDPPCVAVASLEPLIEASGGTLTIGAKAEGLLPIEVLRKRAVCSSYDPQLGHCLAAAY